MISAFSYSGAPAGYACQRCGAFGCKLWRRYQTVADEADLTCLACTEKEQGVKPADRTVDRAAIGWRVLAIPTEDGTTFWGYTSIPSAGIAWWKRLPDAPVSTR